MSNSITEIPVSDSLTLKVGHTYTVETGAKFKINTIDSGKTYIKNNEPITDYDVTVNFFNEGNTNAAIVEGRIFIRVNTRTQIARLFIFDDDFVITKEAAAEGGRRRIRKRTKKSRHPTKKTRRPSRKN